MPTHNKDIAVIFGQVADLLEIEGANPFRVRAYREGARIFGKLSQRVADLIAEGKDLTEISGIGDDLAAKAEEIVDTGGLKQLEQLHKRLPADLSELLRIPGLGPKKVKILYEELDIKNLESLKKAAVSKAIRKLDGFGAKSEANILREIQNRSWGRPRTPWAEAAQTARDLRNYLAAESGVKQIDLAGSFRRKKETVGDLDILVSCKRGTKIMARFVAYEDVQRVLARGKTKSSVLLRSGLQVDLRKLPQVGYGAGLHYFTGAKAHNIAVRKLGRQKGLKINEYGVYEADRRIAGKSEKSVFAAVELPYIPPELRENRGEMQAAREGRLPELIRLADIRGDLHAHTRETDGRNTLEEMAKAARERGYDYLAVTNHSQQVRVARGMDETRLAESLEAMEALNAQMKDFRILKSVEVDILKDGSLDLPGEILKALDLTVCAVHSAFDLSREQQTERI
ncbi:MAG: helix-hairpin-helix domain-containing protein, partial [Desulfobacterales bacterium]